jgi:hypothetical protein
MGVPVVNIGSRQVGRARGTNVLDVDYDQTAITSAIEHWLKNGKTTPSSTYGGGDAGRKIADILAVTQLQCSKRITY